MSSPEALGQYEEIILSAIEIETLDAAGALGAANDEQVLRIVERQGAIATAAGLLLTLFSRRGPRHAGVLWKRLPILVRNDLARLMLSIQPHITARSLGADNLREVLAATVDSHLHGIVADVLAGTFVANSEICLLEMQSEARDKLAVALAERAGRESEVTPDWIQQLPQPTRQRAIVGAAFGALVARQETSFERFAAGFSADYWNTMMAMVQERAAELDSTGIAIFLKIAPGSAQGRSLSSPQCQEIVATRSPPTAVLAGSHEPVAETDAASAAAIIASAEGASANELVRLMQRTSAIVKPTWRREAQRAVLRRLLATEDKRIKFELGLSREDVGAAIVVRRLEHGDTSVLRRRVWTRIAADRRFTLLMELLANLETGIVAASKCRLDDVASAVLVAPGPMREVLALHFITNLGRLPEMTDAILNRFECMRGMWKDDILTALARVYALRGDETRAQELMRLALSTSEDRLRATAMGRLRYLLDHSDSIPAEPVGALVSALATVSAYDLPAAVQLCFERLPKMVSEFLVADVIARGHAADAFAESVY
jgi:hypothetical protein